MRSRTLATARASPAAPRQAGRGPRVPRYRARHPSPRPPVCKQACGGLMQPRDSIASRNSALAGARAIVRQMSAPVKDLPSTINPHCIHRVLHVVFHRRRHEEQKARPPQARPSFLLPMMNATEHPPRAARSSRLHEVMLVYETIFAHASLNNGSSGHVASARAFYKLQ